MQRNPRKVLASQPGSSAELSLVLPFAQSNGYGSHAHPHTVYSPKMPAGKRAIETAHDGQAPALHTETRMTLSIGCAVAKATSSVLRRDKSSLIPDALQQAFICHYKAATSEQSSPFPSLAKCHESASWDYS